MTFLFNLQGQNGRRRMGCSCQGQFLVKPVLFHQGEFSYFCLPDGWQESSKHSLSQESIPSGKDSLRG